MKQGEDATDTGQGRDLGLEVGVNREGVLQAPGEGHSGPREPRAKALRAAGCYFYNTLTSHCHRNAGAEGGRRIRLDLPTRLQA